MAHSNSKGKKGCLLGILVFAIGVGSILILKTDYKLAEEIRNRIGHALITTPFEEDSAPAENIDSGEDKEPDSENGVKKEVTSPKPEEKEDEKEENPDEIKEGMTPGEVKELYGEPDESARGPKGEIWLYEDELMIIFREGEVSEYRHREAAEETPTEAEEAEDPSERGKEKEPDGFKMPDEEDIQDSLEIPPMF